MTHASSHSFLTVRSEKVFIVYSTLLSDDEEQQRLAQEDEERKQRRQAEEEFTVYTLFHTVPVLKVHCEAPI